MTTTIRSSATTSSTSPPSVSMCCGIQKWEGDYYDNHPRRCVPPRRPPSRRAIDGGLWRGWCRPTGGCDMTSRDWRGRRRAGSRDWRTRRRAGGALRELRHIVLIPCDGMGNSILSRRNGIDGGDGSVNCAPVAFAMLATAAWPDRHGEFV